MPAGWPGRGLGRLRPNLSPRALPIAWNHLRTPMTKPLPGWDWPLLPRRTKPPGKRRLPIVSCPEIPPARFEDLIGQEAMVRTLSNAFDLDRIHQAYILTGVRGVGKTTTARILARAFNYELPAHGAEPAVTRPTIHMPELGVHCQAIIESRHVDVIEMDAARIPGSMMCARSSRAHATSQSWHAQKSILSTKCICSPNRLSTVS